MERLRRRACSGAVARSVGEQLMHIVRGDSAACTGAVGGWGWVLTGGASWTVREKGLRAALGWAVAGPNRSSGSPLLFFCFQIIKLQLILF